MTRQKISLVTLLVLSFCIWDSQAQEISRDKQRQILLEKLEEGRKLICQDKSKVCKKFITRKTASGKEGEYRTLVIRKLTETFYSEFKEKLEADDRYGAVIVAFEIDTGGSLRQTRLMKKSGVEFIDQLALELIKTSAPYPKHEGIFDEGVDVIVITEALYFNPQNKLQDDAPLAQSFKDNKVNTVENRGK